MYMYEATVALRCRITYLLCRARRGSAVAVYIQGDLSTVHFYSLFDPTYEGDCMELKTDDEPWTGRRTRRVGDGIEQVSKLALHR